MFINKVDNQFSLMRLIYMISHELSFNMNFYEMRLSNVIQSLRSFMTFPQ